MTSVLLGRYAAQTRPGSLSSPEDRSPALPLHGALSNFPSTNFPSTDDKCPRWLIDRKTGGVMPCMIPDLDRFHLLGCSPWRDGAGQYHIAVRYKETVGEGAKRQLLEMGLARCTYPERRVLDRVLLDPMPLSKVCWYPDRSDTIIYAAADFRLYRYAFSEGEKFPGSPTVPQPIRWEAATLGAGTIQFRDLCWSSNPALGGRLLASLSYYEESCPTCSELHLWWLQLSPDGEAIVAAGSMIALEESGAEKFWDDFHTPAVGTTPDGLPLLAYLARVRNRASWDLWVAPIVEGGVPGVPVLQLSAGRKLAEKCVVLEPVFSANGRWIHAAIWEGTSGEFRVKRLAVPRFEHRKAAGDSSPHSGCDVPACHLPRREEASESCDVDSSLSRFDDVQPTVRGAACARSAAPGDGLPAPGRCDLPANGVGR